VRQQSKSLTHYDLPNGFKYRLINTCAVAYDGENAFLVKVTFSFLPSWIHDVLLAFDKLKTDISLWRLSS